jgi:hypothetical protein
LQFVEWREPLIIPRPHRQNDDGSPISLRTQSMIH